MASQPAIVAVLAGGGGTRIGGAKALVPLAGGLIEHILGAAREAELDTFVVAKRDSPLPPIVEPLIVEPDEPCHPLCRRARRRTRSPPRRRARATCSRFRCDMPFLSARADAPRSAGSTAPSCSSSTAASSHFLRGCSHHRRRRLREALERQSSLRAALGALAPRLFAERELRALRRARQAVSRRQHARAPARGARCCSRPSRMRRD